MAAGARYKFIPAAIGEPEHEREVAVRCVIGSIKQCDSFLKGGESPFSGLAPWQAFISAADHERH
jgi:hypothetical protein